MGEKQKRINIVLTHAAHERLKDAAVAMGTESVSSLLEKGALRYVEDLERERGEAFPPRGDAPRIGRPRKARDK